MKNQKHTSIKFILLCLLSSALWACSSTPKEESFEDSVSTEDTSYDYSDSSYSDSSYDTYAEVEDSDTSEYTSDNTDAGYASSDTYSDTTEEVESLTDSSDSYGSTYDSESLAEELPERAEETTTYADTTTYDDSASATASTAQAYQATGATIYYTVERGDTLMEIAFAHYGHYGRWNEIYELNSHKMTSPELMQAGITLEIPNVNDINIQKNGDAYVIQEDDTLGSISQKLYGTASQWRTLWENNPELIKDPNKIYVGFTLYYQPDDRFPASTQEETSDFIEPTESSYEESSSTYEEPVTTESEDTGSWYE